MKATDPRFLYMHGFGSGPSSAKARAFSGFAVERGISLEALDLRKPSFESMRLSAMVAHVRSRIGGPRDRAVLIGSSLGGLTACRVAEEDPRACALVLMAPAFRLFELWKERLGPEKMAEWERSGFLEVDDYVSRAKARVDHGFFVDMISADPPGWPDVRVPTLIVHGSRDDVVPVELSRAFAEGRRHVRLVEVDDGHDLAASVPLILEEAARFLAPWGVEKAVRPDE